MNSTNGRTIIFKDLNLIYQLSRKDEEWMNYNVGGFKNVKRNSGVLSLHVNRWKFNIFSGGRGRNRKENILKGEKI